MFYNIWKFNLNINYFSKLSKLDKQKSLALLNSNVKIVLKKLIKAFSPK
jgi:hypothetical protein